MKFNLATQKTIASEGLQVSKMDMDADSSDFFTYVLRDKIYSDKILAPIRELITNAYDEHVKYNVDKPIKVEILRTGSQYAWKIRDYAAGLSEEGIRKIFGMYGKSTKRDSNTQVGMFGVGSKSPLAYSDTFYVTSYHLGVKSSYVFTLGRGQNGVPVGEIYKVSDEPTNETGIEISIDINVSDVSEFARKTSKFVRFFHADSKIEFIDSGEVTVPLKPTLSTLSTKIDDIVFNKYDDSPKDGYFNNTTYYIRMGGVYYPHTHKNKRSRSFSSPVIVDVPIGTLSIPISREGIENTPLNEKVFDLIEKYLDQIYKEEKSTLPVPKFGETISGHCDNNRDHHGDWFVHDYNRTFPTTRKFYYKAGKILHDANNGATGSVSECINGKYIVYIFPQINSIKNWHKRLIKSLKSVKGSDYNGYVYMQKDDYDNLMASLDNTIDISDCVFVDIKSLKLPKLEATNSDKTSYMIYDNCGLKKYKTAEELDKEVIDKNFNGEELEDDWYTSVTELHILDSRTIGLVSEYSGKYNSFCRTASKKMISNLKELGWLTPDSDEYVNTKKEIMKREEEIRKAENAGRNIRSIMFYTVKSDSKLCEMIKKKAERLERFRTVMNNITHKEDSTRSRIIKSFTSWECSFNLTRQDLRKILRMKN